VLWVGSPGLAIALASLVPAVPRAPITGADLTGHVLVVAGSANPVTHTQCDALHAHGIPMVQDLADAPGHACAVCLSAPRQRQADPEAVLAMMARQAVASLACSRYDSVIFSGGETMAAILERMGIARFVLGHAERADGTGIYLAMKAGGFGSPSTLLRAVHALSNGKGPVR
jgi:uncharacterized protein YgbK (DUF1537 family)